MSTGPISRPGLFGRLMSWGARTVMKGRFPPGFRGTMGKADKRLPEMAIGLGVLLGQTRRFYTLEALKGGSHG